MKGLILSYRRLAKEYVNLIMMREGVASNRLVDENLGKDECRFIYHRSY